MGYTTNFEGSFVLDKPLASEHLEYLCKFQDTRRMKRDASLTAGRPDSIREEVGLPVGNEGGYFVGEGGYAGQGRGPDVVASNDPPTGQPGVWCKWEPNEDGTAIEWNGAEKFYNYTDWIVYLIEHFLGPWGYVLAGEMMWEGEERSDFGTIYIKDNVVEAVKAEVKQCGPSCKANS